ncbi:gamma carbonic anhydrase family protein [soil metagenome]
MNLPEIDKSAFVASNATVSGRVVVGERAVVMFGAVLRAEADQIEVGTESNIQDNAVVHCDAGFPALIGSRSTIGHSAVVHGATVGDGCLVGIGAIALNGAVIGEGAWLAAGSVLAEGHSIPPWTLALGIPARPGRELTSEEVDRQRSGVDTYLAVGAHYRRLQGTEGLSRRS